MTEGKEGSIPEPGKHLIHPSEAVKRDQNFFNDKDKDSTWTLRVRHLDGTIEEFPAGTDWEAKSRFGSVISAVATNSDGSPSYDRPRYNEAPNVNVVAWGKDKKGQIKIAIINQARPYADNELETETNEPMVFRQIPMGFLDKILGQGEVSRLESTKKGAIREISEETGAMVVKDISFPELPKHYPNPTFVGTSSNLAFVEVDLEKIDELKSRSVGEEQIYKSEYIPLDQLLKEIQTGKVDNAYTRMCTSNSAILIFLSGLKQYQQAERNSRIANDISSLIREASNKDREKTRALMKELRKLAR